MSALGPVSRSLVAAARAELGPDAAAAARVRARVAAAVAPAGAAAPAVAAGAKLGGLAATAKLAAMMLVVGAALGGAWVAHGGASHAEIAGRAAVSLRAGAPAPLPVLAFAFAPPAAPAPAAPAPRTAAQAAVSPRAPAASPPPPAVHRATLAREVELVDRAMTALHAGHPDRALAAITVFDHETAGHGQLAEDAAAIDIEARCRLHAADLAARLAAFDARWPHSAQRPRLTAACTQP